MTEPERASDSEETSQLVVITPVAIMDGKRADWEPFTSELAEFHASEIVYDGDPAEQTLEEIFAPHPDDAHHHDSDPTYLPATVAELQASFEHEFHVGVTVAWEIRTPEGEFIATRISPTSGFDTTSGINLVTALESAVEDMSLSSMPSLEQTRALRSLILSRKPSWSIQSFSASLDRPVGGRSKTSLGYRGPAEPGVPLQLSEGYGHVPVTDLATASLLVDAMLYGPDTYHSYNDGKNIRTFAAEPETLVDMLIPVDEDYAFGEEVNAEMSGVKVRDDQGRFVATSIATGRAAPVAKPYEIDLTETLEWDHTKTAHRARKSTRVLVSRPPAGEGKTRTSNSITPLL